MVIGSIQKTVDVGLDSDTYDEFQANYDSDYIAVDVLRCDYQEQFEDVIKFCDENEIENIVIYDVDA